jgi:hypothetical protein
MKKLKNTVLIASLLWTWLLAVTNNLSSALDDTREMISPNSLLWRTFNEPRDEQSGF